MDPAPAGAGAEQKGMSMGRASSFTEAQVRRAIKAARAADPSAIIEVTRTGVIRILPGAVQGIEPDDEVDEWFKRGKD